MNSEDALEAMFKDLSEVLINQEMIAESVKNGEVSAEIADELQKKLKLLAGEKGYLTVSITKTANLQTVYISTIKMIDQILSNDFEVVSSEEKRVLH